MNNIINLADHRPKGNGAREALIGILTREFNDSTLTEITKATDKLLAELFLVGFIVAPIEGSDE